VSAWLALVVTDALAVTTFARCFTGPGELTAALITLLVVHLVGLAARGGASGVREAARLGRGGTLRRDRDASDVGRRPVRRGWWALALVAAAFLPIGIVLGPTSFWIVPGSVTWHAMSRELGAAWAAYSFKVAPVPELPGLVLATAWAAGAAAALAEMISSWRRIPAAVAVAPALGLYLVAATLGTGSWRVVGLAAIAASGCWYLVAVARERDSEQDVLVASVDNGLSVGDRAASHGAVAVVVRMAALAAVAAGVIGPNLPGASSAAIVELHGRGGHGTGKGTGSPDEGAPEKGVQISTLVQVAEEEIDNSSGVLFTVHSNERTREIIAALDTFNGDQWSSDNSGGQASVVPPFSPPMKRDEDQPPPPVPAGTGRETLVQVFQVAGLGWYNLPTWGDPIAIAGAGAVTRDGPGGSIVSHTHLTQGEVYAVRSDVAHPSTAQLLTDLADTSDAVDLALPQRVPPRIRRLAHSIVAGSTSAYEMASDLQAYLTSPKFHYQLPGAAQVPSPGYSDLMSFLFHSHTGYCQQFATAFAVLARIDGLPTRIVVGFLPGSPAGHDEWTVEGIDTHAWPQVRFAKYGWIDFEPTPGTTSAGSNRPTPTTTTLRSATTTTLPRTEHHHVAVLPSDQKSHKHPRQGPGSNGSSAPWLLVAPVAMLAGAGGVPLWRSHRLRRARRESRSGILAAWREALRTLDLAGIRRRRAETYLELAKRVGSADLLSDEAAIALRHLAQLATAACYGAESPGDDGARQAMRDAKTVARSARRRIARWQRLLAALDPRGLPA